ncbi:flagellar hook-basal body complex protein [Devosia chinhatensis]|uniref:flagellar hook-basal body complex protein n=1 Tax=Devosia chinhatensis TaxID=429727 RepID=UPI000698ECC8|nr:flagellar hook-basal body complex protein [Devosia chinhatensis]
MGIYGALSSAVTGLRAQAHSLENISGNIANSQTIGYKRMETSFVDLIPDAPLKAQVPGAVLAQSRATNNLQGDIQTSSNETFIALNTNGFFVVEPKVGQSDGNSVFAGSNYFTRRGDFEIDKDGLLVNGAGYYLKGLPIDPATGNISGSVPEVIRLSNAFLPANVTRTVNYQANLPQMPKPAAYNATTPNSELLKPWTYSNVQGAPVIPHTSGGALNSFASMIPARATGGEYLGNAAASTVINDRDVMRMSVGGTTYNFRFNTGGGVDPMVSAVSATAGDGITAGTTNLRISQDDLAALHAIGTFDVGGVTVNFGAQTADSAGLQAATQAAFAGSTTTYDPATGDLAITHGLGVHPAYNTASAGEITIDATGDIDATLASLQTALQGIDPTMTAKMRNGKVEISGGATSTAALQFATYRAVGGATTGNMLGIGAGPHVHVVGSAMTAANMPADLVVSNGQTMSVTVGNITRTYVFDTDGTVTPTAGQTEINAGQSLEQMLAAIQADLRANGGAGAAAVEVGYSNGAVQVNFAGNYHYDVTISGNGAVALGVDGTMPAATGSLDYITAANEDQFIAQSIEGGAITVYASNGAPANVQLRWAKVDSAAAGGVDTWNLFYLTDSNAVGGAPAWRNVGETYQFGANGSLMGSGTPTVMINNLTVNGIQIGNVELRHEANGVSQFADVNGTVSVSRLNQNGYGAGEFLSVAITDSGRVVATYSNGERIDMAQVVTAQFNGVNSLKRLDGGVYQSTSESGEPIFDLSGSGILGGALEASNTDISDEFTKLIITQQAYSAATRIVSTADEMLQEALNMVR